MRSMGGGFARIALGSVMGRGGSGFHEYQFALGKALGVESRVGITATARVFAARDNISR